MSEEFEQAIGHDRRTFIKRLVVGSAFAAPVVSSFTMSGVQAVFGGVEQVTGASLPNTTQPGGPEFYPSATQCYSYTGALLDVTTSDGSVGLHLVVPAGALPAGSIVCIYKGNLALLNEEVPAGQSALSAYAVVWNSPPGNSQPDATSPIMLTVTDPAVSAGDAIYVFDKSTGAISSAGTASGSPATWTVTFIVDPAFVVTGVTPVTAQATTTG